MNVTTLPTPLRLVRSEWFDEPGNVADLAVHLIDSGRPDQVGDAIEKPHRFTAEYHAMRAAEAELDQPWGGDAA